jgi:hypothetical protein
MGPPVMIKDPEAVEKSMISGHFITDDDRSRAWLRGVLAYYDKNEIVRIAFFLPTSGTNSSSSTAFRGTIGEIQGAPILDRYSLRVHCTPPAMAMKAISE